MNDLELFQFHLERAAYILKFQDRKLAECWVNQLNVTLAPEYIESFLVGAVFELSLTDSNTFHWVLDNLTDWRAYTRLLEAVTRFTLKTLIVKGFIPGQDFSFNSQGKILLNENTKTAIVSDISNSDKLIIEKILLIPQQITSLKS